MAARILTQPIDKLTSKLVPPNLYTKAIYPNLGPNVEGKPIPYGLGHAILKASLIDTTVDQGIYQWGDSSLMTTKTLHAIVAIRRTDGDITRTAVTDYTPNLTLNQVTIHSGFPSKDFEIEIEATGKPDADGNTIDTFGPVVRQLLIDLLGVPAGQIDISGTSGETKPLGVWLGADGTQRELDAVLNGTQSDQPSVARSVNGRIQMNTDGTWLVRKFNPTFDTATGITLFRSEFVRFDAAPDDSPTYWKVIAYYNKNFSTGNFPYQQATSVKTLYTFEDSQQLQIYTYLQLATDAAAVAAQLLGIDAGGPRTLYDLEERTNKLFLARTGDVCRVTTTPAQHPTGTFTAEDFWIERLQKVLTPTPKINARIRRVATNVAVDPIAIIPVIHWSGPVTGVQDMRANPVLPFGGESSHPPGIYALTVDANMTLVLRAAAAGAGGGSAGTASSDGAGGGGGGAKNSVGEPVVLQQGTTYELGIGVKGNGGNYTSDKVQGADGGDGGDTYLRIQGGTYFLDLQGGRHGKRAPNTGAGGLGGAARVGANSVSGGAGGNGGSGASGNGANGTGSGVPGGGGGGGSNGDMTPGSETDGGDGGNGGNGGATGDPGEPPSGAFFGDNFAGGRGGSGAGVTIPGLSAQLGAGGGGAGSFGTGDPDSPAIIGKHSGLNGQDGGAVFTFVSVP